MRPLWTGVMLCSLMAFSGALACGTTRRGSSDPSEAGEAGTPGASDEASRAGASSGGGANPRAGAGSGGSPVIALPPVGVAGRPEEPVLTPHAATPCIDPQPLPQGGGYQVCEDKSLRVGERTACPSVLPREKPTAPLFYEDCARDADCTESAHGFCAYGQCRYGCVSDDECGAAQLCFCGEEIGKCLDAECLSDADCPADYPCTGNLPFGTDAASFRCQTPTDSCRSDYDCPGPRTHCQVDESQRRACVRDTVG